MLRCVQDALEEKQIEALVDQHTKLPTDDVPTMLEWLLHNYGQVSSEEVVQNESEGVPMTWLHLDPLIELLMPLMQPKKLAEHVRTLYADAQMLQKVLSLIRATRDFEHA